MTPKRPGPATTSASRRGPKPASPDIEASQRAQARRTGIGIAIGILAIVVVTAVLILAPRKDPADSSTVDAPASAVTFEVASRNHVEGKVDYDQTPPVGGDHNPVWLDCGDYDTPVVTEKAVHSMEHGAVWITYSPDLPADQRDELNKLGEAPYVVVSPWADSNLPRPIVVSAWGAQLTTDDPYDRDIAKFLNAYRQAPTSPEPGAACTGGDAGMTP